MSTQLNFTPITEPIKDAITGEQINNGYQLIIPFELFQQYNFNGKLKLYSPTVDFLKTPFILHAWTLTYFTGQMAKKETHINSIEWMELTQDNQPSTIYWPDIQQSDIEEFSYCGMLVVEPLVNSDLHEFVLEISNEYDQENNDYNNLSNDEIEKEIQAILLRSKNGFIVNISNTTNEIQEIKLFTGPIPEGVIVQTMFGDYDFDGLQMAAQIKPFIGNSLTSNSNDGIQMDIVNMDLIEIITLNGRYERPEILIDGQDNYINLICPANSKFYIRLNSLPPEMI